MFVVAASTPILINLLEPKLDFGKMYTYKTRYYLFVAYNQTQSFVYM